MRKMMSQGHEYKQQWRAIHADQLAAYVNFCHDTHFSEPDERSNKRKTTVVPITGKRHRPAGSLAPM